MAAPPAQQAGATPGAPTHWSPHQHWGAADLDRHSHHNRGL